MKGTSSEHICGLFSLTFRVILAKYPFEMPHEGDEFTRVARRTIDDSILAHELEIQSLKRRRNELSPIAVLPPEGLSKIFIFVRDLCNDLPHSTCRTHWICVGHVSHHWREAALGCPTLWSIPVLSKPNLAQEMIHRSKMVPLTISLTTKSCSPRVLKQLQNALSQISRIQSIRLTLPLGRYPQELGTMLSSFSQPAPLLENIDLSSPIHSTPKDWLNLPQGALPDTPRLRDVMFDSIYFSWGLGIFKHRNLISLQLRHRWDAGTKRCSIGQMMDALHHLPNLRILELNNIIPPPATSCGHEKDLEFKFLERLELSDKAAECIFFLRHTRYPASTKVRLCTSPTEVEDCAVICSLIGQNLNHTQNVEAGIPHSPVIIQSARLVSFDDEITIEISFFTQAGLMRHLCGPPNDLDPIIYILLQGRDFLDQASGPFLTSVSDNFDLSSLDSLLMDFEFNHNHIHAIRDSFGKLPKLETICVSQSLPEICLAITESSQDTPVKKTEEIETVCLPHKEHTALFSSRHSVSRSLNTLDHKRELRAVVPC